MKRSELAFDGFRLDAANALLWRGDDPVALAPKPFDVLCHLVERAGQLVTRDELLDAVWSNLHVSEASVSTSINAIRIALGDDAKAPHYIETVARRGYRFIAPVTAIEPASAGSPLVAKTPSRALPSEPRARWLVGRNAPLDTLDNLLQHTLGGNRRVMFVTGEAGIGKTTFLQMAMERLSGRGVDVLWGRCIELFGTEEAFLPLIGALQERCGADDGAHLVKALRDYAPTWLAQMPGLLNPQDRSAFQSEVFGATRERMLREFCDLLEILSADRPWVIILEDLHWSDFATLDVLSRFARGDRKASVLVLGTYRPMDVVIAGHPVRAVHQDLQIHGRCIEIALDRLSRAEVEKYLALRFDDAGMASALAERVFARTKGQPLFVISVVDYLIAKQAIVQAGGQWSLAPADAASQDGMPRDLKDMITHQIERLNPDEQQLLEVASAAGVEFSSAIVAGALARNALQVEQAFEDLARKGHVLKTADVAEWPDGTVSGCYAFKHALYQEVFYQRLAPGQRVRTHRSLGERLEEAYGAQTAEIAAVLALHFEEGRHFAKAVRFLSEAAESSARRFGKREAEIYLTRALGMVDRLPIEAQPAARAQLLHKRGWIRRSVGDIAGVTEDLNDLISCAADGGLLRLEVDGLLDLSRLNLYMGDRRQCLPIAARAVARCQALDDDVFKAIVEGSNAQLNLTLRGWRDEDAELCRQAVRATADAREPIIQLIRCAIESVVDYLSARYADCRPATRRGKQLAQSIGDAYFFVLYNTIESAALLQIGDWRNLRQSVAAALAMAQKNANQLAADLCQLTIAQLHVEALDFEGARRRCEETLESAVDGQPFNFFMSRTLAARACLGLGDNASALAQLKAIIHRVEVEGIALDATILPLFHHDYCEYWLGEEKFGRAKEQAARLYEISGPPLDRNNLALAHRLFAKIALSEGDLAEAERHIVQAVSIIEGFELPLAGWRVYATAARLYERLGDAKAATAFHERSEKIIQSLAANFDPDDPLRMSLIAGFAAERQAPQKSVVEPH